MRKRKPVIKRRSLTFRLLYYWGKFVGLNTLTLLANGELRCSYLSSLYCCFMATTFTYVFYSVLNQRFHQVLPGETPIGSIVHFIQMSSTYIVTTMTWLTFGFHQKRLVTVVKSFVRAERTLRKLCISTNYEKSFRQLGFNAAIVSIAHVVYMTLVVVPMLKYYGFKSAIWISYIFPSISVLNTWVLFIWALMWIKSKYRGLNDSLRFLLRDDCTVRRQMDTSSLSGWKKYSSYASLSAFERIKLILQLHRELRDVTHRIEQHFNVFILIDIITQSTTLTLGVHVQHSTQGLPISNIVDFMFMVSNNLWYVIPIIVLSVVSNCSGSTMDEANKTGSIIHSALNNCDEFVDAKMAAKLNVLSLDLLQNKLRISILGFFNLDESLVFNIVAAATTYLTIMQQFL